MTSQVIIFIEITWRRIKNVFLSNTYSAGNYWSPGRLEDVPSNVPTTFPKDPIWSSWGRPDLKFWGRPNLTSLGRPEMTSRGRPNLMFKERPWEVDSGCALDVLRTFHRGFKLGILKLRCPSIFFFFNFSSRTFSINQIYLKSFQHSRCIENQVKLLRWRSFCKIN